MTETSKAGLTPFIIKVALGLAIFGLAFPIYGVPLGIFRLTIFRMALFAFALLLFFYRLRLGGGDSARVLSLFLVFAGLRAASLYLVAAERARGIQQLTWFLEDIFFLAVINSFSRKFDDFLEVFVKLILLIGGASICVMGLQFLLMLLGKTWILPLSTSKFGFDMYQEFWTYPFYGGQIIGPFTEYNMSGSMCALFIAMFLPFALARVNILRISWKLVIPLIVIAVWALIGTGSRQGFLSVVLASSLIFIKGNLMKKIRLSLLMGGLVLLIFLFVKAHDTSLLNILPETVYDRYSAGLESGNVTGGRVATIIEVWGLMDTEQMVKGVGEGMGEHSTHNAYLITWQETGFLGLLSLVWLSVYFFYKTRLARLSAAGAHDLALMLSSRGVVAVWLLLIFVNWAQLNVNVAYLYLSVPIMCLNYAEKTKDRLRLQAPPKA